MTHSLQFASPWYVAGLRRFAALMTTVADRLDRALEPAPVDKFEEHYELILARAAEESLAVTRDRISRYY